MVKSGSFCNQQRAGDLIEGMTAQYVMNSSRFGSRIVSFPFFLMRSARALRKQSTSFSSAEGHGKFLNLPIQPVFLLWTWQPVALKNVELFKHLPQPGPAYHRRHESFSSEETSPVKFCVSCSLASAMASSEAVYRAFGGSSYGSLPGNPTR